MLKPVGVEKPFVAGAAKTWKKFEMDANIFPFLDQREVSAIAAEFGSVEHLYIKGLELAAAQYAARGGHSDVENQVRDGTRTRILDLEDHLDRLGVDGHRIITQITTDFGGWAAEQIIAERFASLGIKFEDTHKA